MLRVHMRAGTADVVNVALVFGFDASILYFMGFKSLMYLLVGVVLGGGLHPMAGHLIAEHYMFLKVSLHCMLSTHITISTHEGRSFAGSPNASITAVKSHGVDPLNDRTQAGRMPDVTVAQ